MWMHFSVSSIKAAALLALAACWAAPASAAYEPAHNADAFVDSIGVCTHWGYPDTPYGYAYPQVKKLLGELGVRHVRDGYHERLKDLYVTYGIRATCIFSPGAKPPAEQIQVLKDRIAVFAMVEGPNEVDIFKTVYRGKGFPEGPKEYQDDLYAAIRRDPVTARLGVIALSTARAGSNLKLAPLKSFDYAVMHSYAGGGMPSASLEGGALSNILNAERILGPGAAWKPIVATECGYHTALGNTGAAQPGVSERAQAKYIPRTLAEYFNAGILRTFTYEFIDECPDYKTDEREADNAEACFGLVRRDLTPKPAYWAEKNLIAVLKESLWDRDAQAWDRVDFLPHALDFSLSGSTRSVHHTLLRKSGGDFCLLLWQEVPSFDTKAKKDVENPDAEVTVTFAAAIRSAETYLPSKSAAVVQSYEKPRSITLRVPDEVLIVRIVPEPAADTLPPTPAGGLAATAAGNSVTLKWSAAADNTGVAGYFVWRLCRYLGSTTDTTYVDTHVLPGVGYSYGVQAYDRAGNVSPPAAVLATTPLVLPDLVVTGLEWAPARPKAGDAVTFSATIKNVGKGPTPAGVTIGVSFQVDGANVNWSDTSHDPLEPGATRTLTANNGAKGAPAWTAAAGEHTVVAHVDDVNRIDESNEDNNTLKKTLRIPGE